MEKYLKDNEIKLFHDYKSFFRFIDNYDSSLSISIGGIVSDGNKIIAKLIYEKKH